MMLRLEGVEVRYGKLQALWGVSLEVGRGEVVGLIGPNGAGKTSTINSAIGFVRVAAGRVLFDGEDVTGRDIAERVRMGMAVVPEGRRVFPYLTVEENLLMGALGSWSRRRDALELVYSLFPRLKERRRAFALNLSGGEQQMLVIGRALMGRPKLLLVDEPALGLAPKVVEEVYRTLRRLRDEEKITVLVADQNAAAVLGIADRAYIIENGRIVAEGDAGSLARDPKVASTYLGI